jgi:hypothetical protein
MASKAHVWGEPWVIVPLAIIVIIGGVGGAIVVPASRRMADLSRADVEGAPTDGAVAWSAEYDALYRRYMGAEIFLGALVLLAIFVMAAKPFG